MTAQRQPLQASTFRTELVDGVLTVWLSRPDHLNAFTVTMADELEALFRAVNLLDDVRAVIVTGEGRAFCAGMDLATEGNPFGLDESMSPGLDDMRDLRDARLLRGVRDTGGRVALALYDCAKPVIAAINGPAVGIGATMTLPMDIRLAGESARIGFVFARLGIVPEAASSWFLPRIVGLGQALEWVHTARVLTAEEALQGRLVSAVHPDNQLLDHARTLAVQITQNRSPVAIALTRQMMLRNSALDHPVNAHRIDSLAMFWTSIADGHEGAAAFLEKRDPHFTSVVSKDMPNFYPWWPQDD